MRRGKWVADYIAKYLSKEVRAGSRKGKRLWATFGDATWTRVKDIASGVGWAMNTGGCGVMTCG